MVHTFSLVVIVMTNVSNTWTFYRTLPRMDISLSTGHFPDKVLLQLTQFFKVPGTVWLGKYPVVQELSLGKCLSGNCLLGQMSSRGSACLRSFSLGSVQSGKCHAITDGTQQ